MAKTAKTSGRRRKSEADEAVEAAHMLKADHDEVAFEKRLKKIAREKAKATAKRKAKAKGKSKRTARKPRK